MASAVVRVVTPAPCGCGKFEQVQIKDNSVRFREAVVAFGSRLYCQTRFTCTSSADGFLERRVRLGERPAAKSVCNALNPVGQKDVLLDCGEAASQALERMRQLVEQQGGDVKSADNIELLRFMGAKSMDLEKAAALFVSHQKWKSEFIPNGAFTEDDLPTELEAKKLYWIAPDKKGRPVILTLGRNHVYNKQDFTEFKRFLVYGIDKVIAGAPPGNQDFLAIVDLKGLGVKNLDSKSFIAAFDLLQNHYPGRIDKIFMVNVPLIFNGLWKVVSQFLEDGTKKKIIFVENKRITETLLEEIDISYLPKEYGGNADLLLLQDAMISN